jgi:hypothetical protein
VENLEELVSAARDGFEQTPDMRTTEDHATAGRVPGHAVLESGDAQATPGRTACS